MAEYEDMPAETRKQAAAGIRKLADEIEAGKIVAVGFASIQPSGEVTAGLACQFGSDVAKIMHTLNKQFRCECRQPNCEVEPTHAQIEAILLKFMTTDPSLPKLKN